MKSDSDLTDFYVLPVKGQDDDALIDIVELDKVKTVSQSYYDGGNSLASLMNDFIKKYSALALKVDSADRLEDTDIAKVPGEHIYVLDGKDITYEENASFDAPITILVKNAGTFTIK